MEIGAPFVLVSENGDDGMAFNADVVMRIPACDELWHEAPTVSTTMQAALGDALAVRLAERRGFGRREFRALHPGGAIGNGVV
jgi:arabinose-5-phosphate isomerase